MYEDIYHEDAFTKEKYPQSIYHDVPNLKVVGDPTILRRDAGPKVTGQANFANDMMLANMLYLKFKLCPYSHARITSIDTSQAKALPGVVKVYTHDDVPELILRPPFNYVLNNVAYEEGAEVAAVAAEEEDIAEEACALIDVEYEVLPFVLYAKEALEPGAPILFGDTNEVGSPFTSERGDVNAAYAAAPIKVELETTSVTGPPWTGDRPVAPIESESVTCSWENGLMKVWVTTQNPHGDARSIAAQLELPYNRVVALPTYAGVGFGNKGSNGAAEIMAAYVSRDTNRPVKCMQYVEQVFNSNRSCQSAQNHSWKIGVNNDGTMTTISDINIQASGCWGGRGTTDAARPLEYMFKNPNLYLEGHDAATNTNGTGVPRCVQHPQFNVQLGIVIDQVAEAVNMDPTDFHIKNVNTAEGVGANPSYPDWEMNSNPIADMIPKIVADSGWKTKWKGWKTPMSVSGAKRKGIGFSAHSCRHGYLSNPMSAHIVGHPDGTWTLSVGSHDVGGGTRTVLALEAAEELGVPAEDVTMTYYDTHQVQESVGTGGSRVTKGSGTAVIAACRDAKWQLFLLAIAAGKIDAAKPEDLETADGNIYLKADPTVKVAIKDVLARQGTTYLERPDGTIGGGIIGRGTYTTKRDRWMHFQWNACVAEVEVDTDTGEVTVEKIWVEHDAGRVGFYKGAINQAYGGTLMSMARGLYEGIIKDDATGISLNPNYLDYKLPTHMDTPEMPVHYNEKFDPFGPFGIKGIAEPLCLAPAPAVLNAIYNACGARINSTRATPDKILAAIGKA